MSDTLFDWWAFLRISTYSPFRMKTKTIISHLRNESISVADRKQYWYHVQPYYQHQLDMEDDAFIQRLVHTSDHAVTTSDSFLLATIEMV